MRAAEKARGATLAEAAITLLVFITMLLGIIEFGRIYSMYQVLSNAVREGARYAVAPEAGAYTPPTTEEISARTEEFLASAKVEATAVTVDTAVLRTVNNVSTSYTAVEASSAYQFLFLPFGTITLSARSEMRNENN